MTFHIPKVRAEQDADDLAIKIHLFRNHAGEVCGWYVGPLAMSGDRIHLPYLARSAQTRAAVAVVRAMAAAKVRQTGVCLVDPEDLWERAWSSV